MRGGKDGEAGETGKESRRLPLVQGADESDSWTRNSLRKVGRRGWREWGLQV